MIKDPNLEDKKNGDDIQFQIQISQEKKDEFLEILTKSISHWLKKEEETEDQRKKFILEMLENCEKDYKMDPYLLEFINLKTIALIYMSNKMEGTIPVSASQHQTYELLEQLMEKDDKSLRIEDWPVDGDNKNGQANKFQMVQHLRAYKYLCSKESLEKPLTIDIIKETHKQLLDESIDDSGQKVSCGSYRTTNVCAENHQYPKPDCIEKQMDRIVDEFNNSSDHFLLRAAKLFFETIDIHPFINGNGRLCRLLIAYALMKSGVPFPLSLFASKKSRKHYLEAILRVRNRNDYSFLLQMILYSLHQTRINYERNSKYNIE